MKRNVVVLALLLGIAACDRDVPTGPTSPLPSSATQILAGVIEPGANKIEILTIPGGQQVRITLTTLNDATGMPLGGTVSLKFGVSINSGTECSSLQTVAASARLTSHIKAVLSSGAYCIEILDTAGLASTASYTVRLIFGQPGGPDPAETIIYESAVVPGGATSRKFEADADGDVVLVMDAITPGSAAPLGMGIGHPRFTGLGCEISSFVVANPGANLTVPVDAAEYCAKVFDLGGLATAANFTMQIRRP